MEIFAKENPNPQCELNFVNEYTLVVAVLLSAQSTDKGVNKATELLFKVADTPQKMLELGEEKLKNYTGYEMIKLDDRTGKVDRALKARTDQANKFGADFYLSIHHNAGIKGGSGGGVIAIVYTSIKSGSEAQQWQEDLYNAITNSTKLKGNRSVPMPKMDLHEVRESNMPAVLVECGFMDSTTDTPIILTDSFAEKVASACVEVIAKRGKLKKKSEQVTMPKPKAEVVRTPEKISVTYQIWDDVANQWLPNVRDLECCAGIFGHDVCCVAASLSKGNIYYKVHTKGKILPGKWLPEVKNREDFAGIKNKPIDGLMIKTDTGRKIHSAGHLRKKNTWLPFVTGYTA